MALRDLLRLLWTHFLGAGPLQWVLLVVLVVWLGLMMVAPAPPPGAPSRPTSGHPLAWFDCFDCRRGELDSVLALVGRHPGIAITVLGRVARFGPTAADTAALADGLRRTHARTTAWLATHDSTVHLPAAADYVAERLRLFDRAWRVRAAIAMDSLIEDPRGLLAVPGVEAALDSVCADYSQHDLVVLRQVIWARLVPDTLASPLCLVRAHMLNIAVSPGP